MAAGQLVFFHWNPRPIRYLFPSPSLDLHSSHVLPGRLHFFVSLILIRKGAPHAESGCSWMTPMGRETKPLISFDLGRLSKVARRWPRGSVDALACLPRAGQNCSQCRATEARYDRSQHIPQHVRMGNPVEIDMVCVRALFVLCHHEVLSVLELSVSSRMLRRRGKTFVDPESLHVYGCSIYVDGTLDNLETTYKYKLNLG